MTKAVLRHKIKRKHAYRHVQLFSVKINLINWHLLCGAFSCWMFLVHLLGWLSSLGFRLTLYVPMFCCTVFAFFICDRSISHAVDQLLISWSIDSLIDVLAQNVLHRKAWAFFFDIKTSIRTFLQPQVIFATDPTGVTKRASRADDHYCCRQCPCRRTPVA